LEDYSNDVVIDKIVSLSPDYVVFLSSAASFKNDVEFFHVLKDKYDNVHKTKFV
jgi:hypothetical protein